MSYDLRILKTLDAVDITRSPRVPVRVLGLVIQVLAVVVLLGAPLAYSARGLFGGISGAIIYIVAAWLVWSLGDLVRNSRRAVKVDGRKRRVVIGWYHKGRALPLRRRTFRVAYDARLEAERKRLALELGLGRVWAISLEQPTQGRTEFLLNADTTRDAEKVVARLANLLEIELAPGDADEEPDLTHPQAGR